MLVRMGTGRREMGRRGRGKNEVSVCIDNNMVGCFCILMHREGVGNWHVI